MICVKRPCFNSAEEYIEHVGDVLAAGKTPFPPATRKELEALVDHFPDYAKLCLPTPDNLALVRLPAHFGRDVEPFSELWREQLLVTLEADDELRRGVAYLVNREVQQ